MIVSSKKTKKAPLEKISPTEFVGAIEFHMDVVLTFIENRDYMGAATYIQFVTDELGVKLSKDLAMWRGYALFHVGEYEEAVKVYQKLLDEEPSDIALNLLIASCQYYNGDVEMAKKYASMGPEDVFQTRLFFHIAQKIGDEEELYKAHSHLCSTLENSLSLAAIHYIRSHYQNAVETYEKYLTQNPEYIALNVYIAMCLFRLGSYEEANNFVDEYLNENSDSAIGLNLKACIYHKLFSPDIAESQILQIQKFATSNYDFVDPLVKHNLCIFHGAEDGFTVFPPLVPVIPEARRNLAILYLKRSQPAEACELLKDEQLTEVPQAALKAGALLETGQTQSDRDMVDVAVKIYEDIEGLDGVMQKREGREVTATTKFINGDFEFALTYLDALEKENPNDELYYNKAMTYANLSRWSEAERYFLMVGNRYYKEELAYRSWLCRTYIKNGKPEAAWELYQECTMPEEAKTLLIIISGDCFAERKFYYAMKAYYILASADSDPSLKQGLIASAVGVFRNVLSMREEATRLTDVFTHLIDFPEAESVREQIMEFVEDGRVPEY